MDKIDTVKKLREEYNKYATSEIAKLDDEMSSDWTRNCPMEIPENFSTLKEREIYLKVNLNTKLKLESDYFDTAYWIIKEWGGISSLKRDNRNDEKLKRIKVNVENKELIYK